MHLDHFTYAASPDGLTPTAERISHELGIELTEGGIHPGFGTRNYTLPLSGGTYLEVAGQLDHPAAEKCPFGQSVGRRTREGGGWLSWVVAVADIAPIEQRIGRNAVDGHRRMPDGKELHWKQVGVLSTMEDPQLPFFIQWDVPETERPWNAPADVTMTKIEICGSKKTIVDYLELAGQSPLADGIEIEWVDDHPGGRTGIVAATFDCPNGSVRIE